MKILDSQWEQHFIQESQLLEDKLARGELAPSASRLKIALENNILEWSNYSLWAQKNYLLPVLKRGLYKDQIIAMQSKINAIKDEYSSYELKQNHMVVFDKWENKAIILGLEPNNLMNTFKFDYILVLAPPEIITALLDNSLTATPSISLAATSPQMPALPGSIPEVKLPDEDLLKLGSESKSEDENPEDSNDPDSEDSDNQNKATHLELPNLEHQENTVNFNELLTAVATTAPKTEAKASSPKSEKAVIHPATGPVTPLSKSEIDEENTASDFVASLDTTQYWNKMIQDHTALSSNVRKYFDGYVVVKINHKKTELFKMDEELQSENLDPSLFSFDIADTFFANIIKTRTADSISLKLLKVTILDFNYVCATPLFLGDRPVGLILGFKINSMNEQDETALFNLIKTA
jgi:hypothetical protein